MAKSIGQAFKVTNYDPIDVRLVVDNASSLGVVVNGSLAYEGLISYAKDTKKFYRYEGSTWAE